MAGLVLVQTPEEVTENYNQEDELEQQRPNLSSLVSYLNSQWSIAKRRKIHIEREMLNAQRARAGEYSEAEKAAIAKIGGSDAYRNICDVKCRTGAAWIRDIIFQPGEDPFGIEPTPVPDLSDEVQQRIEDRVKSMIVDQAIVAEMQTGQPVDISQLKSKIEASISEAKDNIGGELYDEAKARAEKMQNIIKDQLTEARFEKAASRFIDDLVTYHAGILKGPVVRMRRELKWKIIGGVSVPDPTEVPAPCVDRVHPLDFYPVNPYDIEFAGVYERHRWSYGKLQELVGVKGYREEEIREVLSQHKSGHLNQWLWTDSERDMANSLTEHPGDIDCLECWEFVPGNMLLEFGIPIADTDKHYQIHAFLIGQRLIRVILNPNPIGRRPYQLASYVTGDTIWGRSVPFLLKDTMKAAGSIYRAAINNCAMAWGPISEINKDRLADGDSGDIHPLKRFMTTDDQMSGVPAVRLTDIPYKGDAMLRALVEIEKRADEESGIPAYAHGSQDIGGAGKTSSGLTMLLNMATKTIKDVVRNIDEVVEGIVEGFYIHNMEYHPDQSIKGDCKIEAKGASALVIKEQMAIRLREFLAQTANPIDMEITGVEGRSYALKEAAKGVNLEADKLVPESAPDTRLPVSTPVPQTAVAQTLDNAGNPIAGQDNALPEVSGATA